jgi:predicted short-subunit dehydrogenase-like oxidoreductase (DUF2520 family)
LKQLHESVKWGGRFSTPHVAIIGAGRVGQTLGYLLSAQGYSIDAVVCRSSSHAQRAKLFSRAQVATTKPSEAISESTQIVFLTTPDSRIAPTARELSRLNKTWKNKIVFHTCGALSSSELHALRRRGAVVASLHPLQTFPSSAEGIKRSKGVFYTFEGDARAERMARQVVRDLGGRFVKIAAADKPLYHCAGTFACGGLLAPLSIAYALYKKMGITERTARSMLTPMVNATMEAAQLGKLARSLTGPISRGDASTIAGHLQALRQSAPQFLSLYKLLSLRLLELAAPKLPRSKVKVIRGLLSRSTR